MASKIKNIISLAKDGLSHDEICDALKCSLDHVRRTIRLAKIEGVLDGKVIPRTRKYDSMLEGVLNDWAAGVHIDEIVRRYGLPDRAPVGSILERARLLNDHRAISRDQRKAILMKDMVIAEPTPKRPTLAEEIGIKIGPVWKQMIHPLGGKPPREVCVTLSGGLIRRTG